MSPDTPGSSMEEPSRVESETYNDKKWRNLNLPHDWDFEGPFRNDLENNTGLLPWKGIGLYRNHFIVPESDEGKMLYIYFDGAMVNAKVWLNKKKDREIAYSKYPGDKDETCHHQKFG